MTTGACTDDGVSRTSSTVNTPAIGVSGDGSYTGNGVIIATTAGSAFGAEVSGLGHIVLSGGTLTTSGTDSTGILVESGGTLTTQDGLTIETFAKGATGVSVLGAGASANLSNTSVSVHGDTSFGLKANGGAIVGNDLTIKTAGTDGQAHGVLTETNGTIDLTRATITTTGASSEGLYAYGPSRITGTDLHIVIEGDTADGAIAYNGGEVHLTGGSILVKGTYSAALIASVGSRLTATNVQIDVRGDNSNGAFAQDRGTVTLTGGRITTSGVGGHGLYAYSDGTIVADNVSVTTAGNDADGARAEFPDATVALTGGTFTTSGALANGLSAQDGGTLTATNTAVAVTGAGAAAIQIVGGTAVDPSVVTVTGGSLASSLGPLILSEGGIGAISLNGPIATTSGIVGGQAALATVTAGSGGVTPSNLTLNLNGLGGVAGALRVTGTGNVVNTTFNATNWTGDLIADTGNTPNTSLAASRWTGQAANAADIGIDGSSAWTITGTSNATGTITNAGLIQFVPLSSGFSTLTTGSYVGQGGRIAFNTYLGADNSPTNLLVINGGTASGTTALSVTNAGGSGALTVGDGIRLVQAVNGGATQPGAFALAGRVAAGSFEYLLFRGGSSGAQDWFLRSTLNAIPDPPSPTPPAPEPVIPLYRPEVPLYTPIPAIGRDMGLATLGTLHERVGEEMNIPNQTASGKFGNGTWARLIGESGNSSWSGTVDARARNASLVGIQAGFDIYRSLHDNGHRDHVGLYIAETSYRSSISGFALGQQNLQVGQLALQGPAAGGYWTHFGPSGWYLDAVVQENWFDARATSLYQSGMSTSGTGFTASLEGGYPIRLSRHWQIEPQAQIIYQTMSVNRSRDAFSTVGWDANNAVTGRFGGRLQYTTQDGQTLWQPYLKANLWHGFGGVDRISFGDSPAIENRFGNTSLELGAGFTARITQTTSLYGHVDRRWSVDGAERYASVQGVVGVRFNW
ncbi:autotransporter outer membrane beta-barrel domain-containing protein [Nitrobacter hamburgensis]|uniref:autotransporter family protein n=1 Tax=Nitrobacter hamburgensis TaxID=912 RepID=UPI00059C80C2|nr:autotransporter outer membrane beta-barrel domain-containing protein [Nitrobacter hamburgensis]